MSLIDCHECGHRISDQAVACPNCGAPPAPPAATATTSEQTVSSSDRPASGSRWVAVVLGLSVLALVGGFVMGNRDKAPGPGVASRTFPPAAAPTTPTRKPADALAAEFQDFIKMELWDAAVSRGEELRRQYPDSDESLAIAEALASAREQGERARLARLWTYREYADDMGPGMVRSASIQSKNQIELDSPYGGRQRATLTVRRHPRHGNDIVLQIEKGQLLCRLRDCPIMVRFDEASARRFNGAPPADHSTTTAFLQPFGGFLTELQKATTIRIQPNVYRNAGIVFEFETGGFDASKVR